LTAVHDGEAAARLALSGSYQIVVLDVMMPKVDGIEALRQIRQTSRVPVIMLTARGDDVDRIVGLELRRRRLCAQALHAARAGGAPARHPAPGAARSRWRPLEVGAMALWPEKRKVLWRGRELHLTSIEFNVLEVLMRNAGRVVSKNEISEQALGRPLARFDRSIDVHLSSIRQKLGEGARLIRTVRGLGYHLVKE